MSLGTREISSSTALEMFFAAPTIKSAALFSLMLSHRHTDVSPGEIRLWGIHQQVCVVVMEMRWGERLRERGGRGGLCIRWVHQRGWNPAVTVEAMAWADGRPELDAQAGEVEAQQGALNHGHLKGGLALKISALQRRGFCFQISQISDPLCFEL